MVRALLIAVGLLLPGGLAAPASSSSARHELHLSHGNLAVEGSVAVLRVRFFKDDLEMALGAHGGVEGFRMAVDPEVDNRFLAYFREHFALEVGGEPLPGSIIGSAEDHIDREPVWSYVVRFDASTPIGAARVVWNSLFEVYGDQRNILNVVHFPEGKPRSYYFAPGEESIEVTF